MAENSKNFKQGTINTIAKNCETKEAETKEAPRASKLEVFKINFTTWWKDNQACIANIGNIIDRAITNLGRAIGINMLIGLVMMGVAATIWPELPEVAPELYGIYTGFYEFGLYILRFCFGFFATLFSGENIFEYFGEQGHIFGEMFQNAIAWFAQFK